MRQHRRFNSLLQLFSPTEKVQPADGTGVLDRIGRASGSSLSIESVCGRMAPDVGELIPFDLMSLQYVEREAGTLTEAYASGLEIPGRRAGEHTPLAGTAAEEAARTGSVVVSAGDSSDALASRFPGMQPLLGAGIRSLMTVPLTARGRVVAALTLASTKPDAYSARHREAGELIGARIAEAVVNCREHASLRASSEEAERLAELGRQVGSAPDAARAYAGVGEGARPLIAFDRLEITLLGPQPGTATDVYLVGVEVPGHEVGRSFRVSGSLLDENVPRLATAQFQHVIRRSRTGILETGDSSEAFVRVYPSESAGVAAGLRAAVSVHLVVGDDMVGALTFRSRTPSAYTAGDMAMAERIAGQVAGAMARQRVGPDPGRESAELSALVEIGRLAGAGSMEDTLDAFAQQARRIVAFDWAVLASLDPEHGVSRVLNIVGFEGPELPVGATLDMSDELLASLIDARSGTVAVAESPEELASRFPKWHFVATTGTRSLLLAPLVAADTAFAALLLGSTQPTAYGEPELAALRRIASQIAGPVANARATHRLRREAREAEILGDIVHTLSVAGTPDEVYGVFSERLGRLVPFDRVDIASIRQDGETLAVVYSTGLGSRVGNEEGPLPDTVLAEAIRRRAPVLLQPETAEELMSRFVAMAPEAEAGLRSFIAVPLVSEDSVVGAMLLASSGVRAYAEREGALAQRAASPLAGLMARERLSSELRRSDQEAEALSAIVRLASSAEAGELYAGLWKSGPRPRSLRPPRAGDGRRKSRDLYPQIRLRRRRVRRRGDDPASGRDPRTRGGDAGVPRAGPARARR